ncbi:MAG: hypothetical protein EON90_14900 [Brevundimonas sp.]|nr:MAG: hypothetical protein EON90_14900 [Brevundimonas sp.]
MKLAVASAIAAAAIAGPAFARSGPEVEIRHAVARVAVVVEDRSDIAVEIQQGTSGLPSLRVTRDGDDVRIDGGLGTRGFMNRGDGIRNCSSRSSNPDQPGEGVTVEVRNVGRVNVSDAPLIVIRTPRNVNVGASGAVYGSVGRGATSVDLGNGGCGSWNVANTEGPVSLSIGGSGDMRAGTSTALDISIGGSGSITAGSTRDLDVSIGGSGDVVVARVDGPADVSIAGSGDVDIRDGNSPDLSISIAGSGDVNFGGVAGDVDISMVGGGDVTVARATGAVSRSIMGGGDIHIGN